MKRNKIVSIVGMLVILMSIVAIASCGGPKSVAGVWLVKKAAGVDVSALNMHVYFDGKDKVYIAAKVTDDTFATNPMYANGDYKVKGGKITSSTLTGNVACPFKIKGDTLTIYATDGKTEAWVLSKTNVAADKIKNAK